MKLLLAVALLSALLAVGFDGSRSRAAQSTQATANQSHTQIVLLGTGTPNPDPDRSGPSVAVIVGDAAYIVDFGPGVVRRAEAAFRKGIKALEVTKLTTAFATHLHSDHTVGLADLIFTPWTLGRREPLQVFGPRGIKSMAAHIAKAYSEDVAIRLHGGEPSNPTGYRVVAHEIKPGVVFKDGSLTVKAFQVNHGAWKQAFGYRFETGDRTVVISGDSAPSNSVIENCNGCDVLIHEVYSDQGFTTRPPEWQAYHSRFHTSARQLAELATKAKPGLLILYHQLFWGVSEADLLKEVKSGYGGRVESGHDLDVY
jgi:ribonuclease BN (tRNA processing enzyme)